MSYLEANIHLKLKAVSTKQVVLKTFTTSLDTKRARTALLLDTKRAPSLSLVILAVLEDKQTSDKNDQQNLG